MAKPDKHIFVCTSSRMTGVAKGFCLSKGAVEIVQNFTEKLEEEGLGNVMVTNTGCLGICQKGPIVVVYPDNIWYKEVTPDDVEEIVESHIMKGEVVKRLEI